jgi:hypothetical protein
VSIPAIFFIGLSMISFESGTWQGNHDGSHKPSSIFSHAWETLENPWLQKRNCLHGSLHLHDTCILNPMFGCLSSFRVWCLHALGLTVPYAWKISWYVLSNMHLEDLPCTVPTVVVTANVRDMDDICFVYYKYYLVRQELSSEDPFCIGYCVSEFKTPAFIYLSLYFWNVFESDTKKTHAVIGIGIWDGGMVPPR